MVIYGAGLSDWEASAINTFLEARKTLPPKERIKEGIPEEFVEHAIASRLFAFWLQLGMIRQDRPIFFFLGLIFTTYALINVIITAAMKIWSLVT